MVDDFSIASLPENVDRLLVSNVNTRNGRYILKLREEHYRSRLLVESQTDFSEILRSKGLSTATHHHLGGGYTTVANFEDRNYITTVEDFMGKEGLEAFGRSEAYSLGQLMGELHSISLNFGLTIGKSFVTEDIAQGRADLRRVFERYTSWYDYRRLVEQLFQRHDALVEEIKDNIGILPITAVHGDIGATNNIAKLGDCLGIFDFDNAGDEILLVDFFSTWFGSMRCLREKNVFSGDAKSLFLSYLNGYTSKRVFATEEISLFQTVAALFNGLHSCRYYLETNTFATDAINNCLELVFEKQDWIADAVISL